MNIYIIDDNKKLLELIKSSFNNYKPEWNIFTYDNGKQAIERLPIDIPDVMLIDISLPDINGLNILKEIKEIDEGIQVIIITAYPSTDNVIKALKFGACDFIKKPIRMNELYRAINNAIQKRIMMLDSRKAVANLIKEKSFNQINNRISSIINQSITFKDIQNILKKAKNEIEVCDIVFDNLKEYLKPDNINFLKLENNIIKKFNKKNRSFETIKDSNQFVNRINEKRLYENSSVLIYSLSFENFYWGYLNIDRNTEFEKDEIELASAISLIMTLKLYKIHIQYNIDTKITTLLFAVLSMLGNDKNGLIGKLEYISTLSSTFASFLGLPIESVEELRYLSILYILIKMNKTDKKQIDILLNKIEDKLSCESIDAHNSIGFEENINTLAQQIMYFEDVKRTFEEIESNSDDLSDVASIMKIVYYFVKHTNFNIDISEKEAEKIINTMKLNDSIYFDKYLLNKFHKFLLLNYKTNKLSIDKREKI